MNTENQSTGRKLPLRTLVGYPLMSFGPTVQVCIQMYFLLYFFTDILGINGTVAAFIIMIARIWDAVASPIAGMLLEKTNNPQKMMLWLKCATVPTVIFMVLTYFAPNFSTTGRIIWALLTFTCLGTSQTAYNVPYNSIRPLLTSDRAQRAKLNTFETIFNSLANLAISAVCMPMVAVLSGFELSQPFMVLALIYAGVYILTTVIGLGLMRGIELDSDEEDASSGAAAVSFKEMLKAIATNKIAMMIIVIQVFKMLVSTVNGSAMIYYFQYNIGDSDFIIMSLANTLSLILGFIPALFLVPLHKKFGNAGTAILGTVVSLLAVAVRFVTHDASNAILLSMFSLDAVGMALSNAMLMQCLMDSIDYGEWKTGKRQTAVIMSTAGIGQKIGLAFGSSVAGIVIGAVNYVPDAVTQSQAALDAFFHMNITIYLVLYIVMLLLFIFMKKIEDKLPEMKAEIEARKKHNYSAE